MTDTAKPLAGLKVIELGTLIAGPFASRIMAEFGAEVIKVEAPDGGVDQRALRLFAGIGDRIAGFEIVGAIEHQVVAADHGHGVVGVEPYRVGFEQHMRIERAHLFGGAVDLEPADFRRGVDDLALQIGQRDHVVIDDAQRADTGRRQIHQRGRAEAAGADDEHGRFLQRSLAGTADLAQHDVAGVAFEFLGAQHAHSLHSW